jgi:hypothetical protein
MKRMLALGSVLFGGLLVGQHAGNAAAPVKPNGTPIPRTAAPTPKPAPAASATRMQNVPLDPATGWPVASDDSTATPAGPAGETARTPRGAAGDAKAGKGRGDAGAASGAKGRADDAQPLVSGTQLGSPLLDVYQAVQGPGAWKQIGGVVVWWRVTVYGADGEPLGVRELTHTADTAFLERDRLEHTDGRTFGRLAAQVYSERAGMPMPTLAETAEKELMLFGMQLRMPWLFGDANAFTVVGREIEERGGERLRKIVLEQRPPAGSEVIGPELDAKPRDRFEIVYDPSTGLPQQLVHRFACSLQTRRVLLEDWREFDGIPVKVPARRVYVDESMRPTTTLEILRMTPQRVSERDFRLL